MMTQNEMQSDCKETLIDNTQQTKRNKTTTKRRKMTVYEHRATKTNKLTAKRCKTIKRRTK